MTSKYAYSERMLQISDDVNANQWGGRIAHKRAWMSDGRFLVWQDSLYFEEFMRRARLSEEKAIEKDAHFSKITGHPPLKQKTSNQISRAKNKEILKLFGS